METYSLNLKKEELLVISDALIQLPYRQVASVIASINFQLNAATEKSQEDKEQRDK